MWILGWVLASAQAAGFGSSVGITPRGGPGAFYPSFDVHADPIVLQIHALEFLDGLTNDQVYFGANLYFDAGRRTIGRSRFEAVVQPGVSVDIVAEPGTLVVLGEARVGMEIPSADGGFGIYVVPALGVGVGEPDVLPGIGDDGPLIVGGALQISAWLGNPRRRE
ncbi:MAG: hypothetical protein AAGA48_13355 [Myxococcota bacterium]